MSYPARAEGLVNICIYIYIYDYIYIFMIYVYTWIHLYVHIYIYIYMCVCVCVCLSVCACVLNLIFSNHTAALFKNQYVPNNKGNEQDKNLFTSYVFWTSLIEITTANSVFCRCFHLSLRNTLPRRQPSPPPPIPTQHLPTTSSSTSPPTPATMGFLFRTPILFQVVPFPIHHPPYR